MSAILCSRQRHKIHVYLHWRCTAERQASHSLRGDAELGAKSVPTVEAVSPIPFVVSECNTQQWVPPIKLARWSSNQDYRLQLRELCHSMTSFMVSSISLLMHHNSYVVAGRYEEYTSEEFIQFKHTFLIWNLWF